MPQLPADVQVFERGWLSSNNILLRADGCNTLIDSGYMTHEEQTARLVSAALGRAPLHRLLNTHLHSDHCGGNRILQAVYPEMHTSVPAGSAEAVRQWSEELLTFRSTGQRCERFELSGVLRAGDSIEIGLRTWQIHAAPGHDPLAIVLFEPDARLLISADALWENGFGVVFPELEGEHAFDEVGRTLDLIESLEPLIVIPGHGRVFSNAAAAIERARSRLNGFTADPRRHAAYAAKVLMKFRLLEVQSTSRLTLAEWTQRTPYFSIVHSRYFADAPFSEWFEDLLDSLVRSGAAAHGEGRIWNTERS